jgi:hypothetical protein
MMNEKQLANLTQHFAVIIAYYRQPEVSDTVLKTYASDLAEHDYVLVVDALTKYRKNPKNTRPPLPANIIEILTPSVSPDAVAREIAGRTVEAIRDFGYTRPTEAREYVGPEGWSVILALGGWEHFCREHGVTIDPGVYQAQCRDRVKDQVQHGRPAIEEGYFQITGEREKSNLLKFRALPQMKQIGKPDRGPGGGAA